MQERFPDPSAAPPPGPDLAPVQQAQADRTACLLGLATVAMTHPHWREYLRGIAREMFAGAEEFDELRRQLLERRDIDVARVELIGVEPLLQFFAYRHLSEPLQVQSEPFARLAVGLVNLAPRNPERTVALRKLLESKDCAVRAQLWRNP